MTNSDIADYIDAKYSAIAALRLARKEEWEAVIEKHQSACDSALQEHLDRKAKLDHES
jgi:hypothetical protein